MLTGFLVMAALILLPLILLVLLIGLTLSLWCWKRVGPYVVNFGRWMSDWRNLVPGACLTFLAYMVAWVALNLPNPVHTVGVIFFGVLLAVTVVGGTFAFVALTTRGVQWFWVRYKRQFWHWVDDALDVTWKRQPAALQARPARRTAAVPAAAGAAAEASFSTPGLADRRVPARRAWTTAFWELLLGKPAQPKKKRPRPANLPTTDQALGPSVASASMAGHSEARPAAAVADAQAEPAPGAPSRPKGREKRPDTGPAAGAGKNVVGVVTIVPRSMWRGTLWVVRKSGEAIEWIRIRLNLE